MTLLLTQAILTQYGVDLLPDLVELGCIHAHLRLRVIGELVTLLAE